VSQVRQQLIPSDLHQSRKSFGRWSTDVLFNSCGTSRFASTIRIPIKLKSRNKKMKPTEDSFARSCQSALLFVLLVAASSKVLLKLYLDGNLLSENSPLFYSAATLASITLNLAPFEEVWADHWPTS
jgi:hypothetical protein